jgi:signal transduction histidine kinase
VQALRASRARVMAKANGQRRDIERCLHEGVQQDLFALAVNLQLAEEAADSNPAALKRLLGEMRQDVRDAIESVRTLARGVYPPVLADLGLAAALRGIASGANIPVQTEAPAERYPPDVEAAVYFCCLEALDTVTPEGPVDRASVRVWRDHESLLFEVSFEGRAALRNEVLLDSVDTGMNDRVGALGGRVKVVAEAGRTRVRGGIPLDGDP